MRAPQNIIFDLGGVLLNIDYSKTENAFKELGFPRFNEMYNQYTANDLFENLETGNISDNEFYRLLLGDAGTILETRQLTEAWNAMLLDFRVASLAFLEVLAINHRLFLLSNTNAIHHAAFMQIYAALGRSRTFDGYFEKAWYSHELGLRKPGRKVFDHVLREAGLKPSETLFIDDSFNNIEGAKEAGLLTHLLVPGETIEQVLA